MLSKALHVIFLAHKKITKKLYVPSTEPTYFAFIIKTLPKNG